MQQRKRALNAAAALGWCFISVGGGMPTASASPRQAAASHASRQQQARRHLEDSGEEEEPWENYDAPPLVEWCPVAMIDSPAEVEEHTKSAAALDPGMAEQYAENALGKQQHEDLDRPWIDLKAISSSQPHYDLEMAHPNPTDVDVSLRSHHRQDPPVECVGDFLTPTSFSGEVTSNGAAGCLQWGDALCREDPFAHGIWKWGIDKFDKTLKLWNPLGDVVYSDFEGVRELCLGSVAENVANEDDEGNGEMEMPFVQVHYEHGRDDWLKCDVSAKEDDEEEAMMQIVEVTGTCPDHYYRHPIVEFTMGSADDAGESAGERALWFVDFNGGTFTAGVCQWSSTTGGLHPGSSSSITASSVAQQQQNGQGESVGWGKDQFVAHGTSSLVLVSLCVAVILALLLLTVAFRRNHRAKSPLIQLHHHLDGGSIDTIDIDMLSDASGRESPDGSPMPRTPPRPPPHTGRSPKSHLTASIELAYEDYALESRRVGNPNDGELELLPDTAMASLKTRMHNLVHHSTGTFGYSPASSPSSSPANKKGRVSPEVFIRTV